MKTVQLKEGCTIALKSNNLKPQGMTYAYFDEKDEIVRQTLYWHWMIRSCLMCKLLIH